MAAGGVLAWLFADFCDQGAGAWAQIESSLAPDHTVLAFTLGILVLAALLFGLAPLRVALSPDPALALKTSAATSNTDAGKTRTGKIIVALQMALCVVLLVGGGLLVRTLRNLENTPLGMRDRRPGRLRREAQHTVGSRRYRVLSGADEQAARPARRGIGDHHGGAPWVVGRQTTAT